VTITHPHHPLRGQPLPVVNVRHGQNPDVIVQFPDGSHAAVALSDTDYATTSATTLPLIHTAHLLDLQGLRRLAQFLDGLRQQGRFTTRSS
jgi:hypothetical protein